MCDTPGVVLHIYNLARACSRTVHGDFVYYYHWCKRKFIESLSLKSSATLCYPVRENNYHQTKSDLLHLHNYICQQSYKPGSLWHLLRCIVSP